MENNTILKFDGLSKKFGNKTVVDHISLEIKEGEIFGLLGPNGAGKSTTLNMVCSLLKPTSGNIEIFGMKTSNDMEKIKKKIGYIPQELYYLNAVKAPGAWEFIKGVPHEKVRVGIIDTGAQLDHPDLENVINKDLSVRITCDGIIAPLKGDNGLHGTHVSGIVAAQANNEIGVAGTASAVNNDLIELVEIGSDTGTGNSLSAFVIYKAVLYAIDNNVRVINMSLGGATDPDNIFRSAVDLAINSGCVVVCAAGNENSSDYTYPSDCSGVLSVMALDESCQNKASYSNYGGTDNKVSAPGTGVLSTIPESFGEYNYLRGYEQLSGTSMATPVVAAEAAMILSVNPTLTSTAVKEIIYKTCTDMGDTGYDKNYGCGIINICDAVKTAYNTPTADMPTSVKLSSSSVTTVKGDTFKISASVTTLGQNKGIYYHTEDSGIARVSQDGTITGVSDGETKLIVSTENSITDECVVKVQSIGGKKLEAPKVDEVQTGVYTGARIQWSKIDDADYYQIYASTGDDDTFRYIGSTTSTSYAALMGLGGEEVPASNVTKYRIKAVSNSSTFADSELSSEFAYVYIGQEPNLKADHYSIDGKQITHTKTYKPNPKMTQKQIEKELNRQVVLFEQDIKNSNIAKRTAKFEEIAKEWLAFEKKEVE